MKRSLNRSSRLLELEMILTSSEGLTCAEMARKLDVHRSTISRDITDLSLMRPIYEEEGRFFLQESGLIDSIRFSPGEAVYIYLACKSLAGQINHKDRIASFAIRKLAKAMETISPPVFNQMCKEAESLIDQQKPQQEEFCKVMESLTQSWTHSNLVNIEYQSVKETHSYTCGTLLLLPHAAGQTILMLGYCPKEERVRMFRVDRIIQAEILSEKFESQGLGDWQERLDQAWDVWSSNEPPKKVCLRFSPRVKKRVKETIWHPSQELNQAEDGFLIAHYRVAEPLEMLPWIRGWGCDVEILKPVELRERILEDVLGLSQMYSVKA